MSILVAVFGVLIGLVGLAGVLYPGPFLRALAVFWQSRAAASWFVLLRVGFGVALLLAASDSRFPQLLRALALLSFLSVLVFLVMGQARFRGFVQIWLDRSELFTRVWSGAALGFGGFLVYAVT